MATIFSKIISGEIPCYKIAESNEFIAILDIMPLTIGHTLIIPKIEIDYIFNLDDETLSGLILFSKKIAPAIEKAIPCKRIGLSVIGLEVPHTHIHLIPLNTMDDINFTRPKLNPAERELNEIAERIRRNI